MRDACTAFLITIAIVVTILAAIVISAFAIPVIIFLSILGVVWILIKEAKEVEEEEEGVDDTTPYD